MKSSKLNKIRRAVKYVRIDPYTWIEKRVDETDEAARQRFLLKLARAMEIPKLQPGVNT
jgi:hypothetical protein